MKLKPGLGAFYTIQTGNGSRLFSSSQAHTWTTTQAYLYGRDNKV